GRAGGGTLGDIEGGDAMLGGFVDRDVDRESTAVPGLDQANGRGVRGAIREADEADRRVRGARLLHNADDILRGKTDEEALCQVRLRLGCREGCGVVDR